ncbi:MAG TPA: hypothetical protein VFG69_19460, partial [Nannocystaceae bacterium]|nr:hypothetical protein [Nannocystaceae bacterium]
MRRTAGPTAHERAQLIDVRRDDEVDIHRRARAAVEDARDGTDDHRGNPRRGQPRDDPGQRAVELVRHGASSGAPGFAARNRSSSASKRRK